MLKNNLFCFVLMAILGFFAYFDQHIAELQNKCQEELMKQGFQR